MDPISIFFAICVYCWWLPVLGLVGLPILRIWFKFSWWWMAIPAALGAAVLSGLYLLVTAMQQWH